MGRNGKNIRHLRVEVAQECPSECPSECPASLVSCLLLFVEICRACRARFVCGRAVFSLTCLTKCHGYHGSNESKNKLKQDYRFVGDTYGERLQIIKEDWSVVRAASAPWSQAEKGCCAVLQDILSGHVFSFSAHHQPIEGKEKDSESEEEREDGEDGDGDKDEKDETKKGSTETFSFGRMCAFSNQVMGQKTEGWMEISNLPYSKLCVFFLIIYIYISD